MRHSRSIATLPAATRPARVRVGWAAAASLLLLGCAFAAEPIRTYPLLRLKDGRTLRSVEVINYTTGGILVRHEGGATTVRAELLPADAQTDLNVRSIFLAAPADLAAKVDPDAVADDAVEFAAIEALRRRLNSREWQIANRVALPELAFVTATDATPAPAEASAPELPAAATLLASGAPASPTEGNPLPAPATVSVADLPAVAAAPEPAAAPALATGPAPAGEGNIPEFFANLKPLQAEAVTHADVAGRIVVAPPGVDRRFLAGVEVRAYPAATFPSFLAQAKARAQAAAQRLLDQAVAAAAEKRLDDHAALTAKAERIATRYLDYLPEAPFQTRTDAHGHFTLRHDLREVRLVAVGHARADRREWTYEWVGLTPASDLVLSDANATSVNPADHTKARFAAR